MVNLKNNLEYCDVNSLNELSELPKGNRFLEFIGGTKNYRCFVVPKDFPRSEFFNQFSSLLDGCLEPVYENNGIAVRQDSTFALPGFYILGYNKQFSSFDEIPDLLQMRTAFILKQMRKGMREALDIKYIHMYYEEKAKASSNVHYWLMPSQDEKTGATPLIFDINLFNYLSSFEFKKRKVDIERFNDSMKKYIKGVNVYDYDNRLMDNYDNLGLELC